MATQIIPTPQTSTQFYQDLNQTVSNLGTYFLQSAAMRQAERDAARLDQYQQAQLQMEQERLNLQKRPSNFEQAMLWGQPISPQQINQYRQLKEQTAPLTPTQKIAAREEAERTAAERPNVQFKGKAVTVPPGWTPAEWRKQLASEYKDPTAAISTEENPIYTTVDGQKALVRYGQTVSQFMDDILAEKRIGVSEKLAESLMGTREEKIPSVVIKTIDDADKAIAAERQSIENIRQRIRILAASQTGPMAIMSELQVTAATKNLNQEIKQREANLSDLQKKKTIILAQQTPEVKKALEKVAGSDDPAKAMADIDTTGWTDAQKEAAIEWLREHNLYAPQNK